MKAVSVSAWRRVYLALAACLCLLTLLYWETASSIIVSWSRNPFSLGYFVIPAVVYLAWTRRGTYESSQPAPTVWPLLWLGLLAFLWLLGTLTGTRSVQQLCLVAMVGGFVWGAVGTSAARALLFPLAFLLFALPVGDRLVPVLQEFTARFAVKMLELSGVPVLLEGHVIAIPGSRWQVAHACSGINYFMSSLAIGFLYAGTVYRSWVHRVGFFLASGLVPLAGNGLRVYTTIFIASLGGSRISAGMEHYLYGWFVFAIMTYLLVRTCGNWREEPPGQKAEWPDSRAAAPFLLTTSVGRTLLAATAGLLVVGIAPLSARLLWPPLEAASVVRQSAPDVLLPWHAIDGDPYSWTPRFNAPSTEFVQTYASGRDVVRFYVASYADPGGVELASTANVLFADPWWSAGGGHRTLTLGRQSFRARETTLRSPASSLVVLNWYSVGGTFTGSDYLAKLLLAKASLFSSRQESAAMAVAIEDRPGIDADVVLGDFLAHLSIVLPHAR